MSAPAINHAEWMDALREALEPERPPNSFTASEWRERFHLTPKQARNEIDRLREAGKLTATLTIINGHLANVYTPTTEKGCPGKVNP